MQMKLLSLQITFCLLLAGSFSKVENSNDSSEREIFLNGRKGVSQVLGHNFLPALIIFSHVVMIIYLIYIGEYLPVITNFENEVKDFIFDKLEKFSSSVKRFGSSSEEVDYEEDLAHDYVRSDFRMQRTSGDEVSSVPDPFDSYSFIKMIMKLLLFFFERSPQRTNVVYQ